MRKRRSPSDSAKAVRAIDEYAVRLCARLPLRLQEVREVRGLTRYALARTAGISREMVGRIEAGEFAFPSFDEQHAIAARLAALAAKQTELRRLQTETEAELAAFTPALLAKAFRGEL